MHKNEERLLVRINFQITMQALPVHQSCTAWLDDWIGAYPPHQLIDRWDLEQWMELEMTEAMQDFLSIAFECPKQKLEAIEILRSLCWMYAKFRFQIAIGLLEPTPHHVKRIQTLPQTPQKTVEWKQEAYNLLTGHEFSEVVYGSAAARMRVIQKKCKPVVERDEQICFATPLEGKLSPFQWGWRYEPVVRQIFELNVGPVDDSLGRIRHPTLARLAASPDGIVTTGERAGRLVEIKSPISRTLTKTVPLDYWCQMQLQAEVCDVEAVEYVEIRFGLGLPPADYKYDYVGVVSVIGADPASYKYVYSPLLKSLGDYTPPAYAVEVCPWYILDMHTETVLRNRLWWKDVGKPAYEAFWVDVEEERKKPVKQVECLLLDDD